MIDAGLSRKETFARLAAAGVDWNTLDAILITHEHSDHVAGLSAIARKVNEGRRRVPVFLSRLTAPSIALDDPRIPPETFPAGGGFAVGDIDVTSFTVPHDAIDPVGFSFRSQGVKISIATDLGYLPDSIRFHLCDSDILLLESNHDLDMLKIGPYPWSVKQRVMGRMGHLSNDAACRFVRDHLDYRTSTLILGHLSEHNNYPGTVHLVASQALNGRSLFTRLIIADPKQATETVTY